MEQLYYTSCRSAKSLSGRSGFQVRAASPGLLAEPEAWLGPHAAYSLPFGVEANDSTPVRDLPIRLALLLDTRERRVIVHTAYVPREGEGGRAHSFFTHILTDPPEDVDALDVVRTWGSDEYHLRDDDGPIELPALDYWPFSPKLSDRDLDVFLADSKRAKVMEACLGAVVALIQQPKPSPNFVFVASKADEVARVCFAVARLLPRRFRARFTFSTFEPSPNWGGVTMPDGRCGRFFATLIGREPGPAEPDSVPAHIRHLATLVVTPDVVPEPPKTHFTKRMVVLAQSSDWQEVDRLLSLFDKAEAATGTELDVLTQMSEGDLAPLLTEPALIERVLAEPELVATLQPDQCLDLLAKVLASGHKTDRIRTCVAPGKWAEAFPDWLLDTTQDVSADLFDALFRTWASMTGTAEELLALEFFDALKPESWSHLAPMVRARLVQIWLRSDSNPKAINIVECFFRTTETFRETPLDSGTLARLVSAGLEGTPPRHLLDFVLSRKDILEQMVGMLPGRNPDLVSLLAETALESMTSEELAFEIPVFPASLRNALMAMPGLSKLAEIENRRLARFAHETGWESVGKIADANLRVAIIEAAVTEVDPAIPEWERVAELFESAAADAILPDSVRARCAAVGLLWAFLRRRLPPGSAWLEDFASAFAALPDATRTRFAPKIARQLLQEFLASGDRKLLSFASGRLFRLLGHESCEASFDALAREAFALSGSEKARSERSWIILVDFGLRGPESNEAQAGDSIENTWDWRGRSWLLAQLFSSFGWRVRRAVDGHFKNLDDSEPMADKWREVLQQLPERSWLDKARFSLRDSISKFGGAVFLRGSGKNGS